MVGWEPRAGGLRTSPKRVQGLEESAHCAPVLLALRKLLNLHDPTLLGLEVASLRQQFPDVRYVDWGCGKGAGTWEGPGGADASLWSPPDPPP